MSSMKLYRETPCEVCGNKPWESVYAFRSPGIAHLIPSDKPGEIGKPCPGSGGSREEVTIDQLVFMVANACASHDMQTGPFNMLAELDEEMAAAYRRFAKKHVDFLLSE